MSSKNDSSNQTSSELSDLQILLLSAMFHDIGKAFRKEFTELKNKYHKPELSDHHNILGREFIRDVYTGPGKESIFTLVSHHHKRGNQKDYEFSEKNRELLSLLKLADHIASSARTDIDADDEEPSESDEKKILEEKKKRKKFYQERYFNLIIDELLGETENKELKAMPFSIFLSERTIKNEWSTISKSFKESLENNLKGLLSDVNNTNADKLISEIRNLFKEYLFFIPSYSQSAKQVESLYTHTIYVTALANSLYELSRLEEYRNFLNYTHPETNKDLYEQAKRRVYLVLVKMYGLQKFLFKFGDKDYSGKSAGKILRGRSLLIWLLTDVVSKTIVKKLGLHEISCLSVVSGKAFLLVPENKLNDLKKIVTEIDEVFVKHYYPLRISQSCISLSELDIAINTGTHLDKLYHDAARNLISIDVVKLQKDQPFKTGHKCEVCGEIYNTNTAYTNLKQKLKHRFSSDSDYEKILDMVCYSCLLAIYIGDNAGGSKDFEIRITQSDQAGYEILPDYYHMRVQVKDLSNHSKDDKSNYVYKFYSINRLFLHWFKYSSESKNESAVLYFMPRVEIADQPFDDLAQNDAEEDNEQKTTYLGILKSDFDNLGVITRDVISNVSNLIEVNECLAGLNLSFLNSCITYSNKKYKLERELDIRYELDNHLVNKLYYVYAGGDDLTLIGRFDKIFEFYKKYIEETKVFTMLTFSSSIVLFKSGFPIREVIKYAESGVKHAKTFRAGTNLSERLKNAVHLSFVNLPEELKVVENVIKREEKKIAISGYGNNLHGISVEKGLTYLDIFENSKKLLELVEKNSKHGLTPTFLYKLYEISTKNNISRSKKIKHIYSNLKQLETKSKIMYSYYVSKNLDSNQFEVSDLSLVSKAAYDYPHILAMFLLLNSENVNVRSR